MMLGRHSFSIFSILAASLTTEAATAASPAFLRKLADPAGYRVDRSVATAESLCGPDDMQAVNAYDGTLGQSVEFVRQHKFAVGAMTEGMAADDAKYCTGTLVGPDLFLTASHCIDTTQTTNDFVVFNYETAPDGSTSLPQEHFAIEEIVEDGSSIDYAVLRLAGQPGLKYGWARLRTDAPADGDLITIVQHPSGEAKQIEVGHIQDSQADYMRYADLDTEPGSSGSGILDAHGYLIGVHTNGGCGETDGVNSGVRLAAARSSTVLSRLAGVSLPLRDGSEVEISLDDAALAVLPSGDVGLADGPGGQGAKWRAGDLGDGAFSLSQQGAGGGTVYLEGRVGEAGVSLSSEASLGTRWRITKTDDGRFALRTVASGEGAHWLAALPGGRSVGLGETAGVWALSVR